MPSPRLLDQGVEAVALVVAVAEPAADMPLVPVPSVLVVV